MLMLKHCFFVDPDIWHLTLISLFTALGLLLL